MSSLIITAPHSLCFLNIPYRNCDTAAFVASHRLANNVKEIPVKYFPSTHHRSEIDLNRYISRNTDYRQNLTNNLSDAVLLVDVHSFPRKAYGPDVDVVILDDVPGTLYGMELYHIMLSDKISVAYLPGSKVNDINEEARSLGIPAILIEYGEFIPIETIDKINAAVLKWINFVINNKFLNKTY